MNSAASPLTVSALDETLRNLLEPMPMKDACPNGLQVWGERPIRAVVTGVTANQALIETAVAANADAILVHHGIFWKGDDARLTGYRFARVKALMNSGVALFAYHLPLDVHPTLGNNAQLASRLGLETHGTLADTPWVAHGVSVSSATGAELLKRAKLALGFPCFAIGELSKPLGRVAWCTGAGGNYLEVAHHTCGANWYVTGEISEQHVHVAHELGVGLIVAGHHATERFGVQAVGAHLATTFNIKHHYIEIDSPV